MAPRYSSSNRAGVKPSNQPITSPNFTDPNFDPADFLNDSLSPLTVASLQPNASRSPGSVPLTELSAQVQSLLSHISAQNIRLSSTLSQLTDEILRSGGRLAYEVEVLRGETIGLSETLTEVLRDDITKFVPEPSPENGRKTEQAEEDVPANEDESAASPDDKKQPVIPTDPEFITNLRTLNQVRARLEDVVQTFGDAMSWPLPPSEISFSSSFISVSGPDLGPEGQDREEKGQEMMKKLRTEVTELLDSEGGGYAGLTAASRRVEALRTLVTVWNASAEEKARNRFVDSLANIVEDRRRTLDQQADQNRRGQSKSRSEARWDSDSGAPAGGLFRNLQRLREEIYLE
ncbi:hypothetical protein Pdw03_2239 [Penicillium digitatum]|uniref:Uncharacterized protein n=3 Tax=Penicillium digitatum TaxID=36651 RepID=K9GSU7_PEND2|nr:hypothetical protein PDIP_23730 [Penicillium digitatum Pd1]EKV16166.1 hypothetical protein PDIG_21450 [Penicillium digitatum PHI26]EKV19363.1 hypothetical protein PDIP_23730 [Penicillium digitatum Pd1]KAG0153520.1 hypothetical protein PDIDSM_2173 [Penicillium digitatum]QQK47341.1 hypothetical protein Pdw03_2239 [Penicillium digitatum]